MGFISEIESELTNILSYWENNAIDQIQGGFIGRRDNENKLIADSPKGAVLNARILWTFAAAFQHTNKPLHRELAEKAFIYIKNHFYDKQYGGVYWLLDAKGNVLDSKKQIYAIAFTIYGLAEYYKISQDNDALNLAVGFFNDIEKYAFDKINGGYFEAYSREWTEIEDNRLSEKDANEKKTMNTHLHILEAYTNLYKVWNDGKLKEQIKGLLSDFSQHILDKSNHHLILFMDELWQSNQRIISYGHDIEASWLLLEAAEALKNPKLINDFKALALQMANASIEGLDENGALLYEYNTDSQHLIQEKHWWVQAEGVVGFVNAWQISGDKQYLEIAKSLWNFIESYIVDQENGEWFWGRNEDLTLMDSEDKLGIWKCPYHNSRACLEVLSRLKGNASFLEN
jgi:mannobiose 2-epimerase